MKNNICPACKHVWFEHYVNNKLFQCWNPRYTTISGYACGCAVTPELAATFSFKLKLLFWKVYNFLDGKA